MSLLPKLARQDVFLFLLPGPIRQNLTLKGQMTSRDLTWPVWKSYDLHRIKFLPVWNGFFGDDIESEFLFDFSCFFASNLTQVFVEKFVDLGLVWSAKKCSKLNCYFLLILKYHIYNMKKVPKIARFWIAYIYDIF